MWDTDKAVLRGKFIALNAYIQKEEKPKISNISLHFRKLQKEQVKPIISRSKEIIKTSAEINELENRKLIQKNQWNGSWFFEKISKINKPLGRLRKRETEDTNYLSEMKKGTSPQILWTLKG